MSPSLAEYSGGDFFASRTDISPRPFGIRPKTPEHPLRSPLHRPRTPQHRSDIRPWAQQDDSISLETRPRNPDTRPRTPIHESAATERRPQTRETKPTTPERGTNTSDTRPRRPIHESVARRPQTPETRPRTAQHRGRSPEFKARYPEPRSKTPEPQHTYFEPMSRAPKQRSKTPEPSPRMQETRPIIHESRPKTTVYRERSPKLREHNSQTSFEMGQRSSQAYSYLGSKAELIYVENDDESVLLYPEVNILSPREKPLSRPITPSRRGYETPAKQGIKHEEHFDQMDDSDDDKISFANEDDDDSIWLYPETTSKSGSNTPVHHNSHKSPRKQELQDKKNNEPPALSDESQSFSLIEISRMKGIIKKNETKDETQSILSESYVSVGDYKVRASFSSTLELILDKHGDIASASKLQSLTTRSYYLDMLASVFFELQTTPLKHLKETRAVEMLAIVRDVDSVKIKADWLMPVMEEIVEAVKHYDKHQMRMMEKDVLKRDVLLARQEMEKQGIELRDKEKKMKERRERMTEMAAKLGDLDMRKVRLDKKLAFLSSKVDKFQGKAVLQGIL